MMPYIIIGDMAIRTYIIFIALGALVLVYFVRYREIPARINEEPYLERLAGHFWELVLLSLILATVGARLGFVLVHYDLYTHRPWWDMLAFWRGGLTFHGGLIMVLLGIALYCWWRRFPYFKLLDLMAPYMALTYAVGRIGCFFNACCYGYQTDLPWGVVFPTLSDLARHPTQIYAAIFSLLIFFILQRIKYSGPFPGAIFTWFVILHSAYRFVVEFFRVSPPFFYSLSLAQVFTGVLIVVGVLVLLWHQKIIRREEGGFSFHKY